MTIQQWLRDAANELADDLFPSARLDAEIILAHTIRHPRTFLHAHGDYELSLRDIDIANARLALRKDHVPVAYIIGHKEFYGRRFSVSPSVLIPRPESEQLVELLNDLLPASVALPGVTGQRLVDVGTGSGILGITAKLEHPELSVDLVDDSRHALNIAEKNAKALGADVATFTSDLLTSYPYAPDIVLANLPYVDVSWQRSPELAHEPEAALYAANNGLAVIKRLIDQAGPRMRTDTHVLLEADPRQLDAVRDYAKPAGFKETGRLEFAIALRRA